MLKLKSLTVAFLLLTAILNNNLFAQTGSIRGFIYDKANEEAIAFSSVYLEKTNLGTITNDNGYYSITKIPPGNYTFIISYLGYDTLKSSIVVKANEIITKKFYLTKRSVALSSVNISAEKEAAKTEVQVSITKITPKEIKRLPTIGGEADLAQYLQILPGVIFTGDQGGQLYIRGGTPIQNKVLLDGILIYNPFHSIGLFSVFDVDIIRNADVYTGGFNAEYGGRISSVMDITTRDGNKKRHAGKFAVSPFTSKLVLEGPIKRSKEEGGGSSSYIFAGKTSYLEQSSKLFYTYVDTAGLPYNFNDCYGKVSLNNANGSKLNLFGFNFSDKVNYQSISDLNWNSFGLGSNFVLIPGSTAVLIDGSFAYSSYKITMQEADLNPRSSQINGFNTGLNFTYFVGKDEIKYGFEVLGFKTNFQFFNSVNREIIQEEYTTELGGFFKYKKIFKKLVLEPSIRLHYYASLSEFSPEPRLGLKYNINDKFRIKAAGGLYSQNLISSTSDKDVVNLFYGFLSGSDNLQETFDGKEVTSKLQKAEHAIIGFEYDLPRNFELSVEGYIKNFSQLTSLNRDKLYEDTGDNADKPDYLKKDFIVETGLAQGLDFLLKYDYKKLYLWIVYSLSYVTRYNGFDEYVPHFDRRHNLNIVTAYTFGKTSNWEADARWNFGSGFPFTKTQGFYEQFTFSDGLNTDYTTSNGELGILYAELNDGRLPYFRRLDLTLKRTFKISKNSVLEANVSVINVYNRENIFYFDRVRYIRINQLPILPSIGISLTF